MAPGLLPQQILQLTITSRASMRLKIALMHHATAWGTAPSKSPLFSPYRYPINPVNATSENFLGIATTALFPTRATLAIAAEPMIRWAMDNVACAKQIKEMSIRLLLNQI
ncbi:MAG: hypothetical protein Q9191_002786 [Dirinaria sp. TL-2023a]